MNLDELRKIRDKARKELEHRQQGRRVKRIVVGMGTCGIGAGARDVMAAVLDEIAKRGISDVEVLQTGCAGYCEREPIVTVIDERGEVMYAKVTPDDARDIVIKHIQDGVVVGHLIFEPVS